MRKIIESGYPYIGGIVAFFMLWWFKIDLSISPGLDNALNGIITMASLIICFLGAVLPLIVTARTDSRVVDEVFRLDINGLFFKYIKESVRVGLILVIACIVTYFRSEFSCKVAQKLLVYIDAYLLIVFLLCAFRSYSFIFRIMKLKDLDFKRNQPFAKSECNKELDENLMEE